MMNMVKSLLILVLVSTQLLARDGIVAYLCVSNDGAYSIHFGAEVCPPCDEVNKSDSSSCEQTADKDKCNSHQCSSHGSGRSAQHSTSSIVSHDACDCTHLPVGLALHQPRGLYRYSAMGDAQRVLGLVISLPPRSLTLNSERQLSCLLSGNKAIESLTLTVLSTVVIRT